MIRDYARLAYHGAKKRKLRSWLTMIGIFIGIAAVVALISLSQGLQNAISEQFVKLGSDKLMVQSAETGFGPPGTDVSTPLTSGDKETIEKIKGVDVAVGRLIRSAKIEFKDEVKYEYVISLSDGNNDQERELAIEANDYQIEKGRMLRRSDRYKVVIGHNFYEDYFDQSVGLRDKIKIEDKTFEVIGILKKSGNLLSDSSVLVPETAMKEALGLGDEYDLIALKVVLGEDLSVVEERIKKKLRSYRNVKEGKEDFSVETPGQIMETLNTILMIVQGVLIGIAAISLLVGGIGIMNTMYTAVTERTKEIGIMKAIGARNAQILYLFLIESGFLGFFGGLIGAVIGIGLAKITEFIFVAAVGPAFLVIEIDWLFVLGVLFFSFLIGCLSGIMPAYRASKLKPIDSLRYE